jgi:RNA polymerase sigma-70 factor (ECF subfamily)
MVRATVRLDATPPAADTDQLNDRVRAALTGEPDAVRSFLRAVAPVIRRTCRGALGPGHPDLEDTVQDCLVEVMRALPKYRFEGSIVHYVTKLSLRRAISSRRRWTARTRHLRLLEDLQDTPPLADSVGDNFEQTEMVRTLIRRLRRVQAETLVLRIVLGFSIEEIASITNAPVNTVKTRLRLGKNALRALLEARFGDTSTRGPRKL